MGSRGGQARRPAPIPPPRRGWPGRASVRRAECPHRPRSSRQHRRSAAARAANSPESTRSWRRPIFPKGCPLSIFGAGELDFRVRDGNGYGLSASVTRILLLDVIGGVHVLEPSSTGAEKSRSTISSIVGIRFRISSQSLTLGQVLKWSSPR